MSAAEAWSIVYEDEKKPKLKPKTKKNDRGHETETLYKYGIEKAPRDICHKYTGTLFQNVAEVRLVDKDQQFLSLPPSAWEDDFPPSWFTVIKQGRFLMSNERSGSNQITRKCIQDNMTGFREALEWGVSEYTKILESLNPVEDYCYLYIEEITKIRWEDFMRKSDEAFRDRIRLTQRLRDKYTIKVIEINKLLRDMSDV